MKVFHIEQFKCTLCSNWFCPPYNLPYLLKCTHSICTKCLQKSATSKCMEIICPEDLQRNKISEININQSTKKALQRLMKEHKNFNDTNYLQCIKTLSLNFDQILDSKQVQLKNFSQLLDQIFEDEIKRLRAIYQKIKLQINRPFRIVNDWKDIVKTYLTQIKRSGGNSNNSKVYMNELSHYIEQGRKIKMDLNQYAKYNFKQYIDLLIIHPEVCFNHNFSVFDSINATVLNKKKQTTLKKDNPNNRQSSINFQTKFLPNSLLSANKTDKSCKQSSLFQKITNKTPRQNVQKQLNQKQNRLGKLIFSDCVSEIDNKKDISNSNSKLGYQTHSPFSLTQEKWINSKFQSPQRQFKTNTDLSKLKEKLSHLKQKEGTREPLKQMRSNQNHTENQNFKKNGKGYLKQSLQYSPQGCYENYTFQDSCQKIKIKSTPSKYDQHLKRYQNNEADQILLEDNNNEPIRQNQHWHLQNYNFLKQWQVSQQKKDQTLQVKQRAGYNCQKQKQKYMKKIQLQRAKEAYDQTMQKGNIVELINCQLDVVDLNAYLSCFNWSQIQILKLVRTSLKDTQMNQLLNYMACSNVHTLVLSSNNLTEICIDALLFFVQVNNVLKNVYLSKNNINTLKGNTRAKIQILKEHGINLYI